MIAKKHHQRCLQRKVWDAWHSVIETKWRVRVEKACQAKAQEVCIQLTNNYEAKLASVS
jgi:centrosomal protein POC5